MKGINPGSPSSHPMDAWYNQTWETDIAHIKAHEGAHNNYNITGISYILSPSYNTEFTCIS